MGAEKPIAAAVSAAPTPSTARRVLVAIDKVVEGTAVGFLVAMIVVVFVQVMTRKLFRFVFFWSEEVTLLLLTWFSFMGIAIGFREKLHLAMDVVSNLLGRRVNAVLDRLIDLANFAFGVYLIVYGSRFCALMAESSLPATGLPNSIQYLVMPLTGALTCAYSALQFLGIETRRFQDVDEEIKRDA